MWDDIRAQQLADNIWHDLNLLKGYEDELRFATEPRLIAKYKHEIKRQRESLTRNQQEYDEITKIAQDVIESHPISEKKLQDTLNAIQETVSEIRQSKTGQYNSHLVSEVEKVSGIIDDPKLDSNHKLKYSIPIIPLILSYEGEVELKNGLNLKKAWQGFKASLEQKLPTALGTTQNFKTEIDRIIDKANSISDTTAQNIKMEQDDIWERVSSLFPKYSRLRYLESAGPTQIFIVRDTEGNEFVIKRVEKEYVTRTIDALNCSDPYIVDDVKYIEDGDYIFIFRPYIEGISLSDVIMRNTIGVGGALLGFWAREIMERLSILHDMEPPVIHRDISPRNIIISRKDLKPYLMDFKSAVAYRSSYSKPKISVVGTPYFMAPEQLEGRPCPASDLYSLGMLLIYLASAKLPPSTSARLAGIVKHEELFGHFGGRDGTYPADIWLPQLIALDQKERYQSAHDLLTAMGCPPTIRNFYIGELDLGNNVKVEMRSGGFHILG